MDTIYCGYSQSWLFPPLAPHFIPVSSTPKPRSATSCVLGMSLRVESLALSSSHVILKTIKLLSLRFSSCKTGVIIIPISDDCGCHSPIHVKCPEQSPARACVQWQLCVLLHCSYHRTHRSCQTWGATQYRKRAFDFQKLLVREIK